ncbi:hypothetical protein BCR36DRAFT_255326, partial [Piromyces finnis]
MNVIFLTVQSILNNILQDLEIQNLTNHLKFETLPYFSQIRAITKPELSTFDSDKEVQKVETSHIDNIIVSTYGMVDNSMTNEVFKRKNGFKSRINSYVNPMSRIKEEMNETNNNNSVLFLDDLVDVYGLNDESILLELANLEHEEELNRIQREVMNNHSSISSSSSSSSSSSETSNNEKSFTNSNFSLSSLSQSNNNLSNPNSKSNITMDNQNSQSYVASNNNGDRVRSNVRIDESYNNIIPSNNDLSYSRSKMSKSGSYGQSQLSNSNEEMNKSGSYYPSQDINPRDYSGGTESRSQSFSEGSSQSQDSLQDTQHHYHHNISRSQSKLSSTNSDVNSINGYFMNNASDREENIDNIQNDILIFPEVADGPTLEIIKNNDFQNLLEEILESTVFNILQEANAGEFDLTKKPAFCYYKTYNNCKSIIGSESSIIHTNLETNGDIKQDENTENYENQQSNN